MKLTKAERTFVIGCLNKYPAGMPRDAWGWGYMKRSFEDAFRTRQYHHPDHYKHATRAKYG